MYVKKPRSVSQVNQYNRCPQSYYLSRIEKVWQRPAAWLPQGTAVHAVAEIYRQRQLAGNPMSLEEAEELFKEEYANACNEYCEITPNLDFWARSGPYRGAEDIERRFGIGLEQVHKFVNWCNDHPDIEVWIAPDGTPGIELEFSIELGGITVRGFIDAVAVIDGHVVVIDYKTGNSPGEDFQLGVYSVALSAMFGIDPPQLGYYWLCKKGAKGKLTHPYQIGDWTAERVTAEFLALEANLEAERFDPDPEPSKCQFCDVNASCAASLG